MTDETFKKMFTKCLKQTVGMYISLERMFTKLEEVKMKKEKELKTQVFTTRTTTKIYGKIAAYAVLNDMKFPEAVIELILKGLKA